MYDTFEFCYLFFNSAFNIKFRLFKILLFLFFPLSIQACYALRNLYRSYFDTHVDPPTSGRAWSHFLVFFTVWNRCSVSLRLFYLIPLKNKLLHKLSYFKFKGIYFVCSTKLHSCYAYAYIVGVCVYFTSKVLIYTLRVNCLVKIYSFCKVY